MTRLLPPVSIRAEWRGDRRSRTFPRCSRKSPGYPETDANALMRHLHPRDVTQICRVSLGHYCMYAAEQTFRGRGRNRRNKWKLERRGGRSNGRTGTCYCTMKNSSTCFNRRVFVLARVHPGAGGRASSTKASANSSNGSRAENPCSRVYT